MNTKRRTSISFAVFIGSFALLTGIWLQLNHDTDADGAPRAFRQVLELNGKIWRNLFSTNHRNECTPPKAGKKPRVNGKIGLDAPIDLEKWSLTVIGDDHAPEAQPLTLTMKDLKALPRTDTALQFRCIEGWAEDMAFAGVKFSDFMKAYHLSPKTYVGLETPDGEYYVSVDIESMMADQTLLAYEMNGEPLSSDNGAPLRLVIPSKYGIKNLKRIGKIFFSDTRPPDYWAEQGYDWYAGL